MSEIVLFALLGLGTGTLIAGLGLGIVVAYRGAGVINLAAGAFAMLGAYTYYGLRQGYLWVPLLSGDISFGGPIAIVPALLGTLLLCGAVGALVDVLVFRQLRDASPLAKVIATLGLLLLFQALILLRFGTSGQAAASVLPASMSSPVGVFGVEVPGDRLLLLGLVVVTALILWALYRFTSFGLATRAAAERETLATYLGISPNRLSLINSVIACVLWAAVGILAAPITELNPTVMVLAAVPALGAALLAGFTSFGIVAAAGIGIGSLQSLISLASTKDWFPKYASSAIPGTTSLIIFLIVMFAAYWRAGSLPERGQISERRLPPTPRPERILLPAATLSAAAAIAMLVFPFDYRQALIGSLIGIVMCLSIVVVTGMVGQVSLMQVALAGVSGLALSKLAVEAGIAFPLGPVIAIAGATAFGMLAALPALRVRGMALVIVTLAAVVALQDFGYNSQLWGGGVSGAPFPGPRLFGIELGPNSDFLGLGGGTPPSPVFGLGVLLVTAVLCVLVLRLRTSALGHDLLAVRANERAAAAAGISVQRAKLIAFGISSAIAGCGGVLYAYGLGSVSAERFTVLNALAVLAFAYIGGITTVAGAIVGGLLLIDGLIAYAGQDLLGIPTEYQLVLGAVALIATVATNPQGVAGSVGAIMRARRAKRLALSPRDGRVEPRGVSRNAAG